MLHVGYLTVVRLRKGATGEIDPYSNRPVFSWDAPEVKHYDGAYFAPGTTYDVNRVDAIDVDDSDATLYLRGVIDTTISPEDRFVAWGHTYAVVGVPQHWPGARAYGTSVKLKRLREAHDGQ